MGPRFPYPDSSPLCSAMTLSALAKQVGKSESQG